MFTRIAPLALLCLAAAALPGRASFIYYSTVGEQPIGGPNSQIKRANPDGSGVQTILSGPSTGRFGGIAFDLANGHLYTGDGGSIIRANLDGSGRVILASSPVSVADVEVDLVNGKIYWGSAGAFPTRVFRADLDGTNVQNIISNPGGNIEGIAIDPVAGKLYMALLGDIHVSNLDGSGRTVFKDLPTGSNPFDVEIDLANGFLYWNDNGRNLLQRARLDGTGPIETILASSGLNNGSHFDVGSQTMYFANGSGGFDLNRVNADGTGATFVLTDPGSINYMEVLPTRTAAVPEPASLAVFGVAGLGLLGVVRRRRKSA